MRTPDEYLKMGASAGGRERDQLGGSIAGIRAVLIAIVDVGHAIEQLAWAIEHGGREDGDDAKGRAPRGWQG